MNEKEALEAIDGLLLSDGSLTEHLRGVRYSMCQSKHTVSTNDHLKWEYWLRDNVFAVLGISATAKLAYRTYSAGEKKGQKYLAAQLHTERTPLLEVLFDEWYDGGVWSAARGYEYMPSALYVCGAVKVVPGRILNSSSLSSHLLAQWLLGDGGSHVSKRGVVTKLATCGYTEREVYGLMNVLDSMGIWVGKPSRQATVKGSGLSICLLQEGSDVLMSLVEPHIMEIFGDSVGPSYKDLIKYKRVGAKYG